MCKHSIHDLLKQLPKCEHHMHIEGSLTADLLFRLAESNNITLPADDKAFTSPVALAKRYLEFSSLDDFLHYYYIGMSVLITESDFEQLARSYFTIAARDGVAHAEIFFDPQAHLARGIPYGIVLNGLQKARKFAESELGLSTKLICCFLRHLPVPECIQTFELSEVQASITSGEVDGIGLDSSEKDFPPALFTDLYKSAAAKHIKRTAHAGEEGPPSHISDSLDLLAVQRIDHGIRVAEDVDLMKRVAAEKILLTVCPLSNVWLRVVKSVKELPIRTFLNHGIQFSINSDDPAYFGNHYILDNYCAVQDAFDLTPAEWLGICRASIEGSWCDLERKQSLLARLNLVFDAWAKSHDLPMSSSKSQGI